MKSGSSTLRAQLRAPLDAGQADRLWQGIAQRRRARARTRALAPALAAACVLGALAIAYRAGSAGERASAPAPADGAQPLRLASGAPLASAALAAEERARTWVLSDGTRLALTAGTRLATRVTTAARTELLLERGRARFEVAPQHARRFEVVSSGVRVAVVGTVFSVERAPDAASVAVAVERGHVRVHAAGLPAAGLQLGPGARLRWPEDVTPPASAPRTEAARSPDPQAAAPPPAAADPARAAFRAAVAGGDYERAYAALGARGFTRAIDAANDASTLLELSDVARAADRPELAARALSRLLARHPDSEHAALAALTLGRLQLDALDQPSAAARSLARALELGLASALQEDALAQLVHACARAGDTAAASRAAEHYRSRYPRGRWRASVDGWAGAAR